MTLEDFINQYGSHIESYKKYDNGVLRIKFAEKSEIMWLKGIIHEELGLTVKSGSSVRRTRWFH